MNTLSGGWTERNPHDEHVLRASLFALETILGTTVHQEQFQVLEAKSQVVAGVNYEIEIRVRNGFVLRVVVYERFDGSMSLTSQQRL